MLRCACITALLLLGSFCTTASAATPEQLNAYRSSLGLPALIEQRADAEMQAIAADVLDAYPQVSAADAWGDWSSDETEVGCACLLRDDKDDPVDPARLYRQRTGRITAWATLDPDLPLEQARWAFPWLQALLAHPRARSLALIAGNGSQLLVVALDPDLPFTAAQPTAPVTIDPAAGAPPAFLFPPSPGAFTVYRSTAGAPKVLETRYSGDPAESPLASLPDGSTFFVVLEKEDRPWAWGSRYSVVRGAAQAQFTTSNSPPALNSGRWQYARSMRGRYRPYRQRFLRAVRAGSTAARQWARRLAASVQVKTHQGGSVSLAGPGPGDGYEVDYLRGHLEPGPFAPHVVWHELGHVVDFSSMQEAGTAAFRRVWRRSSGYRRCFPAWDNPHACVGEMEIFADQFAFWATGNIRIRSGYNIPPLMSRARFGQLLRRWAALRPSRVPPRLQELLGDAQD